MAGLGLRAGGGAARAGGSPADDTAIGTVFTFVLGFGVFFVTVFSMGAGGARAFRSPGRCSARSSASVAPKRAWRRPSPWGHGVLAGGLQAAPVRLARRRPRRRERRAGTALGLGFVVLMGIVTAEATQAVGALLLLGLLTGPAAAAHRLAGSPFAASRLRACWGLARCGAAWRSATPCHRCRPAPRS